MARKGLTKINVEALDELQAALAMSGDRRAFELLYRRWHPRLLRHARRFTGNAEDAADVCQDAAMAIARNIHRLKSPESFGPWAYTIVRNRAASHIKKAQRNRRVRTQAQREAELLPETSIETNRSDNLIDLIKTLPPRDQEVLHAHYVIGLSVLEISTQLCIPLGTVKSRLYAARAHLKSAYLKEGDHHG